MADVNVTVVNGSISVDGGGTSLPTALLAELVNIAGEAGSDRIQTGLDRTQTGLDRTQTGLDRAAADLSAQQAAASALANNTFLAVHATALPRGVTSVTIGGTAITGATPGTYPLTFTGGSVTGAIADLVVDTSTAAHIVFHTDANGHPTNGLNLTGGTSAPTITNPAGATLPVGTTLTAVLAPLIATTGQYWAPTSDSLYLARWMNDGTATPAAVLNPNTTQIRMPIAGALTAVIDLGPVPASPAGIWPEIQDADGRVLEGVYPGGVKFSPLGTQPSDITTLQARAVALESVLPNYPASPEGIIPAIQDADGRIIEGFYPGGAKFDPLSVAVTQYQSIFPMDARLLASDYIEISEQSTTRLRFHRPIVEGNNFQYCAPGARVGFVTNARYVQFRVGWNTLVTRNVATSSYDYASVLAEGVEVASFVRAVAYNVAGSDLIAVDLGSSALRKIELIWPYWTGMDLLEVLTSIGSAVSIAPARPATIIAFTGDSITHGAIASKEINSWAYGVAATKGWQMKNFANGSAQAVPSQGSALAGCGASRATLMIGYNDWNGNVALATYQANVLAELQNMRTALPTAKIYAITPIYTTNTGANTNGDTIANFRTAMSNAFTAWADGNSTLVNGLSLMTNSSTRLADASVHPNDLGASEIVTNLSAIIS